MRARSLLVLPLVAALALTGCGSGDDDDGVASGDSSLKGPVTEVTISDEGCTPAALTLKAGANTFHVTNEGSSAVTEFEVLGTGDKILGEIENVAAGLDRSFSMDLKAGSYVTYCPHGTRERGTLEVTKG